MMTGTASDTGRAARPAGTLLVASAGGHLKQLHDLRPRLTPLAGDVIWVTFDTAQARTLLAGERVVHARFTSSRDWRGVLVNTALARRLLSGGGFTQVVSTGSAIALSFLPLARSLGADVHYIESATRVDGPSLTGKLLAGVPGIHLYNQHAGWAGDRWRYIGSVYDAFATHTVAERRPIRRVVVTLGTATKWPFRRLLERLVSVLPPGAEVLWQTGCTDTSGLGVDGRTAIGSDELGAAMRNADVVVSHAGNGSALAAMEAGKYPVLVPRSAARGEVVDDHQEVLARELASRDLAVAPDVSDLDLFHLRHAAARRVDRAATVAPMLLDGARAGA